MKTKKTKSCLLFIILFTFFITGSYAVVNSSYSYIKEIYEDEKKTEFESKNDGSGANPRSLVEPAFRGYYIVGKYAEVTFRASLNTVFVTITGDDGFLVYEESVNVSFKPILNIDISNYSVGSYRISAVGENGASYYADMVVY